jgi:hypothetical protein
MDDNVLDRIEKQMEGTGLALAAVAEVLQKMDYRLNKAEEDDYVQLEENAQMEEMELAQMEKSDLIKSIASEVVDMLKAGQYGGERGVPVDGEKVKSASSEKGGIPSTGGSPDADDSEAAITIDTKTENVQGVIQAMEKQLDLLKQGGMPWDEAGNGEGEDEAETSEEEEAEGSEEEPVEQTYMEQMQKMVQAETESRLRKMGFREENSLNGPQVINYDAMGMDGTSVIAKGGANTGDEVVDQLMNLSYKQLRELQLQIDSGDTEGVPQELITN